MTTSLTLPAEVITVDVDGTLEDPWACCHKKDRMGGTDTCRHLREDTLRKVRNIQNVYPDAQIVILSWRAGLEQVTRQWLKDVGVDVAAVFVPGGADTRLLGAPSNAGQVGFKVGVVRALKDEGVIVLASFDDNPMVVEALQKEVWGAAIQAPRMVKVEKWEWRAGYIGAPKPAQNATVPAAFKNDWYNTRLADLAGTKVGA